MPSILELVREGYSPDTVRKKIKKEEYSCTSLFTPRKKFNGKCLYDQLKERGKYKKWRLEDFVKANALDFEEKDDEGYTLIQRLIIDRKIDNIKILLMRGIRLCIEDYKLAKGDVKEFLDYRPGTAKQPSIFEFCSTKERDDDYEDRVRAIIHDQGNTTDADSSSAETMSADDFSDSEEKDYEKRRKKKLKTQDEDTSSLRLIAARGVHFSPKFFNPAEIKNVKKTLGKKHPTFSQATLFGAGYPAASEIDERDKKIQKRHKINLKFFRTLEKSKDHKEEKIGTKKPCTTRNKQKFDNLYYRFMQVYINSYSHMFNNKAIQIDYKFDLIYNPLISASWKFDKAAMYASGFRFDWKKRGLRKDPHYRRFTGAPKHPNMGYLDVYVFDVVYVRDEGFDRELMCKDGLIKLKSTYRHEGEVIFHSMIPAEYHMRRCMISLPSFNVKYSKNKELFLQYGIKSKNAYDKMRGKISSLPEDKESKKYKAVIDSITENAAGSLAVLIEKTARCRLFKDTSKVVVYDYGNELGSKMFKL